MNSLSLVCLDVNQQYCYYFEIRVLFWQGWENRHLSCIVFIILHNQMYEINVKLFLKNGVSFSTTSAFHVVYYVILRHFYFCDIDTFNLPYLITDSTKLCFIWLPV